MATKTWNEIAQMKDDGFIICVSVKSTAGVPMSFNVSQEQIDFRLKHHADDKMNVSIAIFDVSRFVFIV